ncbi:MAG: hypothetical protein EPO35_00875 [Acidobacteria bacterium]|nr:MAG: hypothetical protein EPO35_00875 [Acidobacteriota bacterium]
MTVGVEIAGLVIVELARQETNAINATLAITPLATPKRHARRRAVRSAPMRDITFARSASDGCALVMREAVSSISVSIRSRGVMTGRPT